MPSGAPQEGVNTEYWRLMFLNRASATLLSSLDYRNILQKLSELAVPHLGDWCAVDMVKEDGGYERLAVTHTDPSKVKLAHEVWDRYPPQPSDPTGLPNAIRTGRVELVPDISESLLASSSHGPEHLAIILSLGLKSYIVAPLICKERVLGALTVVHAESGRRYTSGDLPVVEEFARVAAIAVENALLFEETARARARAEASEQAFRAFVENLPALAFTTLPDGHVDFYNRRWYEYTGSTPEEMRGWGWEGVHDPALLPKVVEQWKRSLETGDPFEMEFTLRGADGVPRWFLTRITPNRDASGKIVRWFGTSTNIHDIKMAQALSDEMATQSREVERMLLDLREAKERAEKRVAELEAEKASPARL